MKILVMPNTVPYKDMVLDNHLRVGEYDAVKTRSYRMAYRGPVLFYNSTRIEPLAMKAYEYQRNSENHKVIIGIADLVEVRPLTSKEGLKMVRNFNNMTAREVKKLEKEINPLDINDPNWPFWFNYQWGYENYIAPFKIGFFFKKVKRFREPIPFNWPAGPIRPIFIESARHPKIHAQLLLSKSQSA